MTTVALIAREMRVASRHGATYWLRVGAVGVPLLALGFFGVGWLRGLNGLRVFALMHYAIWIGLWLGVPLLVADCLARERREGTLGLLFLTPLRASEVVVAKVVAHALRVLSFWLALAPLLVLPVLMGGVGWRQVAASVATNFAVLLVALAAGLVASVWSVHWNRAAVGAVLLAFVGYWIYWSGWVFVGRFAGPAVVPGWGDFFKAGYGLAAPWWNSWEEFFGTLGLARASSSSVAALAGGFCAALLGFAAGFAVSVRSVRRLWRKSAPPGIERSWHQTFCKLVVGRGFFRRWMARTLERNPVGWLQQRTWSARVATGGWLIGVMLAVSFALGTLDAAEAQAVVGALSLLLAGSVALSAAGSFQQEREAGVVELLLVTPLTERQIVNGRMRGLWWQYLPAAACLLGSLGYLNVAFDWCPDAVILFAAVFATLPVVGLFFSLRCGTLGTALGWTLLFGLLLPLTVKWVVGLTEAAAELRGPVAFWEGIFPELRPWGWSWDYRWSMGRLTSAGWAGAIHLMMGLAAYALLIGRLKRREFGYRVT